MKGSIRKLLKEKKCGFIKGDDGKDYFFHVSALRNCKFEDLREGDEVSEFEETKADKGPRAEEIFLA